jgi:putative endonuclease
MLKQIELLQLPGVEKNIWYVYFLKSAVSSRSYIGMTNDVLRRLRQHNGELVGGARYTNTGRPWLLVNVYGPYETRSIACKVEWRAKRFRGEERFKYRKWVAELDDLAADKDSHLHFKKTRKKKR